MGGNETAAVGGHPCRLRRYCMVVGTIQQMMSARTMDKVTDADLDELHEAIDALLRVGAFKFLDSLLVNWELTAWRTPVDLLVGYAVATYPAKSKLPSRKAFMDRCKQLHAEPELWKGLE